MKTLSELRAVIRSPEWQKVDRTDQLIRSIQQSMRAEGYEADEKVIRDAIKERNKRLLDER